LNSHRGFLVAALVVVLSCTGCSDRVSQTLIVRPQIGRFAISGHARVVGRLTGTHGDSVGTRTLDTESGIRVRLLRPDASTDSVLTQNGAFTFRVDEPGLYRVRSYVCPEILSTLDVEIVDTDAILPDTLTSVPVGPLTTYPNPFPSADGLAIEFTAQVAGRVEITIRTLAGVAVWTYAIDLPPGFQHFHWSAVDNDGQAVPNGPYWCVVRIGNTHQYNLVFKE
jgi:hypothetical protein